MKAATILLLLFLAAIVTACARTTDTQTSGNTNPPLENTGQVVVDPTQDLTSDPIQDIGTLDDVPVDDSVPQ